MRIATRAAPTTLLLTLIPFILLTMFMTAPIASAANDPPLASSVSEQMLRDYCHVHGYRDVKLAENTAYGWKCEKPDGQLVGIYMAAVCAENNKPTPNVIAWFDEGYYFNPLYAWGCVQLQHGYQGHLDMNDVCKKFGYRDGAFLGGTGRHSVDDWMCRDGNYVSDIRLSAACTEMYGGTWADYQVPVFNYWDPYSIDCWR